MAHQRNGSVVGDELDWMYRISRRQSELEQRWNERSEVQTWWNGGAPKEITDRILQLWRVLLIVDKHRRFANHQCGTYVVNNRRLTIK